MNAFFMAKSIPKVLRMVKGMSEKVDAPFDVKWVITLYLYSLIIICGPYTILFFFHPLSGGDTRIHPFALAMGLSAAAWAAIKLFRRYSKL